MWARLALVAMLGLAHGTPLSAEPPSASDTADRPGFADSAVVIGRGHVQLEAACASTASVRAMTRS
jgi:hypothetical protein